MTNLCNYKPSDGGQRPEVYYSDGFRGRETFLSISWKGLDKTTNHIHSFPAELVDDEGSHSKRLDLMSSVSSDSSLKQKQSSSERPMQLEPRLSSLGLPICVKVQKS